MKNVFIIVALLMFGVMFSVVSAECTYSDDWFFECVQEKYISLNENIWEESNLDKITLDLSQIDMPPPKECITDFCYEESNVIVILRKTWKPFLSIVNSDSMTTWGFAKEFDDIKETILVNNRTPIFDRVILQKVLYDRGLLWTKPTGKIWYLTELAIMRLQCIKWYSEYNTSKTIFEIGPQTIKEINNLKNRMKDQSYLASTSLPNVDLSQCGNEFVRRQSTIEWLLDTPPSWANNDYGNMVTPDSSLEWDWEVILKKVN